MTPAPPHVPPPPPARRNGAGIALGVVLVVVGLFYLVVQVAAVDLSSFGWPLFVIIPGVTLLIVGMISLGSGAAIPGGILTMVGLVLAYQNSTGHWTSWAYAWALVAPGGVGLGLFLQGLRERNGNLIRQGRSLMFIAALIFMVGFVFFESILNISGINDQPVVKAALPALFIVIGILLLARSISNSRRTERAERYLCLLDSLSFSRLIWYSLPFRCSLNPIFLLMASIGAFEAALPVLTVFRSG
jgi:hypothetical protein